jgi:cation diffusion facilitator CzcD-associated flavoprotein CzcO
MNPSTSLLIIGAGPFGLALARYARQRGIDHVLLGRPMEFWKSNMPSGMLLRSACDWHLDPFGTHTIEKYLAAEGLAPKDVEPLSLSFYLGYADWFRRESGLDVVPRFVQRLDCFEGADYSFRAWLDGGESIEARHVVIAPGFRHFKHVPEEVAALLPSGRYTHTCDCVNLEPLRGKRCLIVGGRQSAFEWAALLAERGAARVHVSHRHPSPAFAEADWSWVTPLVDGMEKNPGWFRRLSLPKKEELNHRLWAEGRLKVEPWLEGRVDKENISIWPETRVVSCGAGAERELEVGLDNGETLAVDHVILATGYKVDIGRVPFLNRGNILARLAVSDGHPELDDRFQTNVPGLFITSMPATRDFGPFLAFTVSARASAKVIGGAVEEKLSTRSSL